MLISTGSGTWGCQINVIYTSAEVKIIIDGTSYECATACMLTNHFKPSFETPGEIIEGERNCVQIADAHPDALEYHVIVSGQGQQNVSNTTSEVCFDLADTTPLGYEPFEIKYKIPGNQLSMQGSTQLTLVVAGSIPVTYEPGQTVTIEANGLL